MAVENKYIAFDYRALHLTPGDHRPGSSFCSPLLSPVQLTSISASYHVEARLALPG